MESKILAGRRYESPFSVEELLNLVIPKRMSQDVDMDPCKAPAFIGKLLLDYNQFKDWKGIAHNKNKIEYSIFLCAGATNIANVWIRLRSFSKQILCTAGDIAYPEGNATSPVKKSKRKFRDTRDNFDVRDTFSEPRVGKG